MKRLTIVAALLVALLVGIAALAGAATGAKPAPGEVTLQFLAVSDWHGQLEPIGSGAAATGGAAVIKAYWDIDRANNPNTLAFTAGDAYGASPPISNFFDEVPAVQALRMMGINADTFGNHNFDRGVSHLQQMIDVASAPAGEQPGRPFKYVAANLKNLEQNLSGVDAFTFFRVAGLKVAVIGAVNEEAPTLVNPAGLGTLEITDAAAAINRRAAQARKNGADVVLVLTHKGVRGFTDGVPFGELIDLAEAVKGVDVIFGDHTDIQYEGVHNGVRVVEARSKGLSYSKTSLRFKQGEGVLGTSTQFVVPLANAVTPDPDIAALVADYRARIAPIMSTVIGTSGVKILRSDSCGRADGRLCESLVGNVTTDALRSAYGTDFAITNSGGLRAALTCPDAGSAGFCPSSAATPPFPITRGSVLGVLPFGNVSVTLMVSGAEVKSFLENGVSAMPGANGRFPQVSGLCFTYDVSLPAGSRVTSIVRQAATGSCSTEAVLPGSTYTLATNDFMAQGGDGYPVVMPRATTRNIMDADLAAYVTAASPLNPTIQGRINCTTSGAVACPVQTP
jgi:2',3'-cyclic-nucleotide 2'-phosphodiesterase (5'-nucleotidase family)